MFLRPDSEQTIGHPKTKHDQILIHKPVNIFPYVAKRDSSLLS